MNEKLIKVCDLAELKEGAGKSVKIFAKAAAVFKVDGKIYAVDGQCKHMKACLIRSGRVSGSTVRCIRHNWKYNIKTGNSLDRDFAGLKKYSVKINNESVYLNREEILNGTFKEI